MCVNKGVALPYTCSCRVVVVLVLHVIGKHRQIQMSCMGTTRVLRRGWHSHVNVFPMGVGGGHGGLDRS